MAISRTLAALCPAALAVATGPAFAAQIVQYSFDETDGGVPSPIVDSIGPTFSNRGKVLLIWPFMDQRVGDHHDAAFVKQGRHAHRALRNTRVKHVVDQIENMRRFPRGPGDQAIPMPMGQHQRGKHMPVTSGQTVNILMVKSTALKAVIQMTFVVFEVICIGCVDNFNLRYGIAEACGLKFLPHIITAPDDQSLTIAGALILNRGTQHTGVIAFGKDHTGLRIPRAGIDRPHDRRGRVQPGF